ncbi:hypothetical protein jhhlp_003263 [Lomentospora prolificans]|uniref:CHY-type domain-containing protein n=1 Tax=Lomentospora prolificans TaxID=41688 RepID=A0A2N3NGE9_9PEZI|nr:hypothetical protein jhhlp_003263 [Lomentospora prolificans]
MPLKVPLGGQDPGRGQAVSEPSTSRVVTKPVPSSQENDPRGYQLAQLRRRYNPKETTLPDGGTSLVFRLVPSDPDFPFDLDYLECDVRVPAHYPKGSSRPALAVKNSNIPRGFAINIERGWEKLAQEKKSATLLTLTNLLDKNLETFLSEQKAETVKLVAFKDTRHLDQLASSPPTGGKAPEASTPTKTPTKAPPKEQKTTPKPRGVYREPSFTKDQISEAKARRAQETRQLENRMSRMSMYRKSADGIVYTLPIDPKRRSELPPGLQGVRTLHLIIPLLYPLQPLRVQFNEVDSSEAEPVEELFTQKAAEQKQMTLTSHLNYLATNMHVLAKLAMLQAKAKEPEVKNEVVDDVVADQVSTMATDAEDFVKSHIQVIPRPPEWGSDGDESDSDDWSHDGEYDSEENTSGEEGEAPLNATASTTSSQIVEKGTAISFPTIELYGIELLQVSVLNLSVKCSRCKTLNDITGLKHGVEKAGSCSKCANPFAVNYSQQLVHQNSTRAGLIDMGGCTIADMLLSTFVPVCAKCSTPSPGVTSVRGDTTSSVCRECHARFSFKIPEVKFLLVSPGSLVPSTGPRRRQERLGLHAGEPLPDKGACKHYKKSYRWFRFSCCGRVHPCDKCHDEAEAHINEWANRMICGFCSREQNYAVDSCAFCGRSVIGRRGKGFWEGGKGTRDRTKMSRKDPRKHRRVGGSEATKKKE